MFRFDMTVSDVERLQSAEAAADADVSFQMDEDAFRAFYDRTARTLWNYLARLTGDRQTADDLLQETYYRFLRTHGSWDSESHRRAYLFRIATKTRSAITPAATCRSMRRSGRICGGR